MASYSVEQHVQMIKLYYQNGCSLVATMRALRPIYGLRCHPSQSTIQRLVAKFESTGSVNNRQTLIRQRKARSSQNIAAVRESVQKNPRQSIPFRAQELGLSQTSIWRILIQDLGLHPYKIQPTQELKEKDHRQRCEDEEKEMSESGNISNKRSSRRDRKFEPSAKKQKLENKDESKTKPKKNESKTKPEKKLMNKTSTDYSNIDFNCSKTTPLNDLCNFKISSWNVDGIRAWLNKGGLDYIKYEKPDIFCLQETKCSKEKLPNEITNVPDYLHYWVNSEKEGYAGVGIYSKKEPISLKYGLDDEEFDDEGRIITAEYEQFYLICTYVPNAGRGLVMLPKKLNWNIVFQKYVKSLDSKKPVIICGDMNVSHLEIDLSNPKTNKKSAGFTQEERCGMTDLLNEGFVDTFRNLYPDRTGSYTFWTYMGNCRAKNVGWRLDYAIVSERLMSSVCDNIIRSEVFGSDHCPITLFLNLK